MKFRWETEFKDTEIGEIPKDWEVKKIGDKEFKIIPSGINYFEGFKEYISTSCVDNNQLLKVEEFITYKKRPSRANMQPIKNSVWFARMINSPKFLFATEDLIKNKILSTGFLGIKTDNEITAKYLYYYIQTKEFQEYKDNYVTGAVQESLTNEMAINLTVVYPPLPEQSRIVTVLSWFDDLIENKRKQNEILEKTAMAIFKNWFIDFEPFKDGEFVDSELGMIPKGWEVKAIGELFNFVKGKKCKVEDCYIEGHLPYLLIETYKMGNITYWTDEKHPICDEFDIVIVADGESSGKILRYQKGVLGSTLLMIKHKNDLFDFRHFVYLFLKNEENELIEHRTGSAIPHLDKNFLHNFLILLPPPPILQKFHSLVEPLFQKIITNQKQIMVLRKIRDTLLPLLVFGKLRVDEI